MERTAEGLKPVRPRGQSLELGGEHPHSRRRSDSVLRQGCRRPATQAVVDQPVERPLIGGELDASGLRNHVGEANLVAIDVFAQGRVTRDRDGELADLDGVHDRAGTGVTDDNVGLPHQVQKLLMGHELVAGGHRRGNGMTMLDDDPDVRMSRGDGVEPADDAIELVVIGSDRGSDELGHRRGPTSVACG